MHIFVIHSLMSLCMHVQSLKLCPTLCDLMDCNLPGFFVHAILQARILDMWPCPPPEDLPNSGIEPKSAESPALQAYSLSTESPRKPQ